MRGSARSFAPLAVAVADCLALGMAMAFAEHWLLAGLRFGSLPPLQKLGGFAQYAVLYGMGVCLLAAVLRSRRRVAAACALAFGLGPGGLWLYRLPPDSGALLFGLGWVVGVGAALALARWLTVPPRAARLAHGVAGIAAVAVLAGCLIPPAPAEPPAPWPAPAPPAAAMPPGVPNVLLITLDTVRADHLSAYGYRGITTSNLDRLARQGVRFERAVAQATFTPVSHASLLTGRYPAHHGLRNARDVPAALPEPLLAQTLRRAGFRTGAIVAAPAVAPRFGLDAGFDVYHYAEPRFPAWMVNQRALLPSLLKWLAWVPKRSLYTPAPEVTEHALAWLDTYGNAPFLLWVHYFDAHDPYQPDAPFDDPERRAPTGLLERFGEVYGYDGEILAIDAQVGRLLADLESRGILDRTLVVAVSDHGEGLGDHGYRGHTRRLFDEQLRAVLMMRYPPRIPAGGVVRAQVRVADVMPTLLELLDVDPPEGLDGRSLVPLLTGAEPGRHRTVFSETLTQRDEAAQLVAVQDGRYKLIVSGSNRVWLYDLDEDPAESRDLSDDRPGVVVRLRALIDAYRGLRPVAPGAAPEAVDPRLRGRLRALGYTE